MAGRSRCCLAAVVAWLAGTVGILSATEPIDFLRLPTDYPVTTMALTEDGKFLVLAHREANLLTVWDTVRGEMVARDEQCPAPRYILCRGDRVFVANYGRGTIRVYSQTANFRLVDELAAGQDEVYHLTAPQGEYFTGKLLATCGAGETKAVFLIDSEKDERRKLKEITTHRFHNVYVDYTGRFVFESGYNFRDRYTEPGIGVYRYEDYLASSGLPISLWTLRGGRAVGQAGQNRAGSDWLINAQRAQGIPPEVIDWYTNSAGMLDHARPLAYSVFRDPQNPLRTILEARLQDDWQTPVGEREFKFADGITRISHSGFALADDKVPNYFPDLAVTIDDWLYMFFLENRSVRHGGVYRCRLPAFQPDRAARGFPDLIAPGSLLEHPLPDADPRVEWSLRAGPRGAALSGGRLIWTPEETDLGEHRFRIVGIRGDDIRVVRYAVNVVADPGADAGGEDARPAGPPGLHLLLSLEPHVTVGLDRRSVLVLQSTTLRILDASGMVERQRIELPDAYRALHERDAYYVALAMDSVDLIDKQTRQVLKKIPLPEPFAYTYDIALHPNRPLSYVTALTRDQVVNPAREEYRAQVVAVEEQSGRCRVLPNLRARHLAVDPQGTWLYGIISQREHAPDWLLGSKERRTNTGDSVMSMLRIDGRGRAGPTLNPRGVSGGFGLRVSEDGNRLAVLSDRFSPPGHIRGRLIPLFERGNITQPNEVISIESMTDLAFHPYLDMLAVQIGPNTHYFQRSTLEEMEPRHPPDEAPPHRVTRIYFTPDGRHLLACKQVELEGPRGRSRRWVLQSHPLRLTEEELERIANRRAALGGP